MDLRKRHSWFPSSGSGNEIDAATVESFLHATRRGM